MQTIETKLNVISTCTVARLDDGRIAVLYDTGQGEAAPELAALLEDESDLEPVILAALEPTNGAPKKPKARSLRRDADAKAAILDLLVHWAGVNSSKVLPPYIGKQLGLQAKRLGRLLDELVDDKKIERCKGDGGRPSDYFFKVLP